MIIPNFQTIMLFLPKQIQNGKAYKIDGEQLADLMIDFNLAVTTTHTFTIKRIDNDYFDAE